MIRLRHKLFLQLLRLFDIGLLLSVLLGVILVQFEHSDPRELAHIFRAAYRPIDGFGLVMLVLGWLAIFNASVHYDEDRFVDLLPQIRGVLRACGIAALCLWAIGRLFDIGRFNARVVVVFWVITTLLAVLSRVAMHWLLRRVRLSGHNYRYLLIVGDRQHVEELAVRVDRRPELGYKIIGCLLTDGPVPSDFMGPVAHPILGTLERLREVLKQGPVDEVLFALSSKQQLGPAFEALTLGQQLGVVVRIIPNQDDLQMLSRATVEQFEGQSVVTFFREAQLWHLLAKRLMDIVLSAILLVVFAPLMALVAILVRVTSPGPVFFIQERVGMNKRLFPMYKFRSMYSDAEARKAELERMNEMGGPVFKMRNDPRITPLGRFIRQTSIDELPQLWNVFKGDMSLVGPRPPIPKEVDKYVWMDRRRLSIRPGITCLWQISGRNQLTFDQWMELDRKYIENWTIWLDISILFRTIPAVLLRKGAV